ncbi:MAG: peptide chain release factor N(5)-glutamine methyltransferase [Candidatus Rokuibacteriota bacterium]
MVAVTGTLTLRAELAAAVESLTSAGVPTPRVDAEWLLAGVLGVGRLAARLILDQPVSEPVAARYRAAVGRRARREPLQRVLGWEGFRGLTIGLTADVLVPRPETEALAQWALELLPPPRDGRRPLAVDVGTGSGCIACALAAERPDVDVLALDVSPAAAAVARDNAVTLSLAGRVRVVVGDLLDAFGAGRADLVVSNPPYCPSALLAEFEPEVRLHEPRVALDGGPDGLALTRRIVGAARGALRPSGALVLETAGGAQSPAVVHLMRAAGFREITVGADLAGVDRFVVGKA